MKPSIRLLTVLMLAATMLAACRTHTTKENFTTTVLPENISLSAAYAKKVWSQGSRAKNLTASLDVSLDLGGRNVSCNGKLRMKRDDVIQLSLTLPLIGTEVGRLECTPQEVLLVDRINRQYLRAAYKDVDFLAKAELDFHSLQALFWNELFVPGKASPKDDFARFRLSKSGAHTLLSLKDAPRLEYDFLTRTDDERIARLNVRSHNVGDASELECVYADFTKTAAGTMPTSLRLSFHGTGRSVSLGLRLSRIGTDTGWQTRTTLSDKYTQRKPEEILRQLGNML